GHTRQYEHPGGPVRNGALDVGVQTITEDEGSASTGAAYAFFVQRTHRFARDDRLHTGGVLDDLDEGTVAGGDALSAGGSGVGIVRHVEHASRHREGTVVQQVTGQVAGVTLHDRHDRFGVHGDRAHAGTVDRLTQPGVPHDEHVGTLRVTVGDQTCGCFGGGDHVLGC